MLIVQMRKKRIYKIRYAFMPTQEGHVMWESNSLLCIFPKWVIQLVMDVIVTSSPQYTHTELQ